MKWYSKLSNFQRMVLVVMVPQVLIIIAAIVVFALGHTDQAQMIGLFGSALAMILISVPWTVFVDSRDRWPDVRPFDRYARIITFYRD